MPQGSIPVLSSEAGSTPRNFIANNAGVQIFTGIGVVDSIIVGNPGTTSSITLYDGLSTAGINLGIFTTTAEISLALLMRIHVGLFAVLAGGAAANVTVTYRQG